jgi:hypothetical protein
LELAKLGKIKGKLSSLSKKTNEFLRDLVKTDGVNSKSRRGVEVVSSRYQKQRNKVRLIVNDSVSKQTLTNLQETCVKYLGPLTSSNFGQDGLLALDFQTYNDTVDSEGIQNDSLKFNLQQYPNIIKNNNIGLWGGKPNGGQKIGESGDREYMIDLGVAFQQEISKKQVIIDKLFNDKRNETQEIINLQVREQLGFNPSVKNVFAIILANVEVFIEILVNTSERAELQHLTEDPETLFGDGTNANINSARKNRFQVKDETQLQTKNTKANKGKIYPWPTYWERRTAFDGGEGKKETYPGVNTRFLVWEEVIFVEEFLKALTELKKELEIVLGDVQDRPGFDNFAPLTTYETQYNPNNTNTPNRWYKTESGSNKSSSSLYEALRRITESAFLVGDYSFLNRLSTWKTQLGFDDEMIVDPQTGQSRPKSFSNPP